MGKESKPRTNYEEYVLEVMEQVCRNNSHPIKQMYAEAVAELKTKKEGNVRCKFKPEDVRPNVSKAIDRLCSKDNPPLICYKGKYYVPNRGEYLFEKLSEEFWLYLRERVVVDKKEVLLISYNTCALWVSKNPGFSDEEQEKDKSVSDYIAECLGDYGYAVFGTDNFFQVMVKCTKELGIVPNENSNEFSVIRALEEAITRIYEETHITLKKKGFK